MAKLSKVQKIQESSYQFPYHYIPSYDNQNFSQVRNLSWGYEYLSYLHFVLNCLWSIDFNSLLDVGCGDGRFLFEVSRYFPDKNLVGIDFSERAIKYATALSPNVKYICGDITNKTLTDDKFDVAILIEALEHIPPKQINDFLQGIHFYLRDSGVFIITVPSKNIPVHKKHYQHFDIESLKEVISPFFEIEKTYFLNKISFKVTIINKIFSNRYFILNNKKILNFIYNYYNDKLLHANNFNSRRICLICRKNNVA